MDLTGKRKSARIEDRRYGDDPAGAKEILNFWGRQNPKAWNKQKKKLALDAYIERNINRKKKEDRSMQTRAEKLYGK